MNRFVSHRSVLFLVVAWVVIITLFADGANLDDLASGTVVIHDDEQVTQVQSGEVTAEVDQAVCTQHVSQLQIPSRSAKPASMPAAPVRIVIDQDSPSLAAEWHLPALFESIGAPEFLVLVRQTPPAHDALYLQFCTLLI